MLPELAAEGYCEKLYKLELKYLMKTLLLACLRPPAKPYLVYSILDLSSKWLARARVSYALDLARWTVAQQTALQFNTT